MKAGMIMRTIKGSRLIALTLIVIAQLSGCGGEEAENPIVPSGEVPDLLASMPDEQYLALGYLDFQRAVKSEIGQYLLTRYSLYTGLLQLATGINLANDFQEIAFAVRFNDPAYPNFVRAFPVILAVRTNLTPERIIKAARISNFEKYVFEESDVYRYEAQLPLGLTKLEGVVLLASPEQGLIAVSTSRELLESYLQAWNGQGATLGTGGKMAEVLDRLDKRVPGWMAVSHTEESRSLLKWLADFDECLVSLDITDSLDLLCVMDFPSKEDAEESFKYFEFNKRQLENLISKSGDDETSRAMAASAGFMLKFDARASVDLAIYSATFDREWLDQLIEPGSSEPATEMEGQ